MILVVDHYDSFVYNIVQLVGAIGFECDVVRSDAFAPADLVAREPDAVILSPGPGRPEDAGCFIPLIRALPASTPLLGVCLGHQALGVAYGARVGRGPEPVHGKASRVMHDGAGILASMASPFEAGRYHSLVVERDGLSSELEITAETGDGVVMAIQHRELPRYGVQFHPESILTPDGPQVVKNFLGLAAASFD